jgi:hypothetical protein
MQIGMETDLECVCKVCMTHYDCSLVGYDAVPSGMYLHGVTAKKNTILIFNATRTSNSMSDILLECQQFHT